MAAKIQISFSKTARRTQPDALAPLFEMLHHTVQTWRAAGKEFISLAVGAPESALLPIDTIAQLAIEAKSRYGADIANYTHPQGFPPFRQVMSQLLQTNGVQCTPEDMLVTSGGLEALGIGATLLLDPGDTVITEGPGFVSMLSKFAELGAHVVQLPVDEHGMDPQALEAAIKKHHPKLLSLMPDYLNPNGAHMPLARRQAIAGLLKRYDMLALEDGTYSLLRLEGENLPPIQSFAPNHVLYVTSVSKVLAPSMRLGLLVAPPALIAQAVAYKSAFNMQASAMNQAVASLFFDTSESSPQHLARHLDTILPLYRERRDVMTAALKQYFPEGSGYRWTRPQGGMFVWLEGPRTVNFTDKTNEALEQGVAYVPGSLFYTPEQQPAMHNSARLNFASCPTDKIEAAVRRLAQLMSPQKISS